VHVRKLVLLQVVSMAKGGGEKDRSSVTKVTNGTWQTLEIEVPGTGGGTTKLKLVPTVGVPPQPSMTPASAGAARAGIAAISRSAKPTAVLMTMCAA
jgi:hypothetical protein